MHRRCFLPLLFLLCTVTLCAQNGDRPNEVQNALPPGLVIPPAPVLVASEALKTIRIADGYRLEIAAADPLIGDPVAINFGPDGRLWVVEMRGFMPNPDGRGEDAKIGTVAVLEDTDHDGFYDKRTEFIDGLVLPRALLLVDDGLLVAEPPHLWFARDTDGDGRADEKTEVASDYGAAGNPEHTANGLYRALDNWIYSANHNVRFRYLGDGKFAREFTIMRGQWGLSQDDTGRLFYNTNSDPLRYDAVPSHYFARQPALTDPAGLNVQIVPANLRLWPARVTPGVNRGYQNLDATGRITTFTAACAPQVYRGDLLPGLRGEVFVAEPSGNLIKRITLNRSADLLSGINAYDGTEFIASTDERFRPVNLADGPDGALYVVDMYRGIIQHRIYLTSFLRKQIESRGLAEGLGMGRIYRVIPEVGSKRPEAFDLAKETTPQLIAHLSSPIGWWRDTAQRLLVERRDPAAIPLLRKLATNSDAPALARLHALWGLEGLGGLDQAILISSLGDPDPAICAAAIRLSEGLLAANDAEMFSKTTALIEGPDTPYPVLLQLGFSLGASPDPQAVTALLKLSRQHGARPAIADAIVSSLTGRENAFIAQAFALSEPGKSAATVALAASCVWRTGDAAQTAALDSLFSKADATSWVGEILLDSLKSAVPVQSDGAVLSARLAAAPNSLLRVSNSNSTLRTRATDLLTHLRWPGHEAAVATVAPLTPAQEKLYEKGRTIFMGICAGCHQPTGLGLKGLAPALVNSRWVAGDERALARIVLQGKMREGAIMPPLQSLDDESLAGALTFIRRTWGHGFAPVDPAAISRARAETAGRAEPWSDKELAKLREPASVPAN